MPSRRESGVQAFCKAKPWRRRNLLPLSKCNHRRAEHPAGVRSPKKDTTHGRVFFWWTRSDSNRRPPQCECDALPAALLAHSSAYWRNRFIIAQLAPLCNAKNCTNLAVLCPNRIARTAPRAFGARSPAWNSLRCPLVLHHMLSPLSASDSAPIGGKSLVDALLQRFRLLLFRDGAHDGFSHDIALAIHHLGGRIGQEVGGELACLTVGVKIHILIRCALLHQHILCI